MAKKVAIIQFPGSNCEYETLAANYKTINKDMGIDKELNFNKTIVNFKTVIPI